MRTSGEHDKGNELRAPETPMIAASGLANR
jgi:hypothetical protein